MGDRGSKALECSVSDEEGQRLWSALWVMKRVKGSGELCG